METRAKTLEEFEASGTCTANIKHSLLCSRINPHIEGLFTSVSINAACLAFNQKLQGVPKGKKKQPEERKQSSEPESDMMQMLGLSNGILNHYD